MNKKRSAIDVLASELQDGRTSPGEVAAESIASANQNAGQNVFLAMDSAWALGEAERIEKDFAGTSKPTLYGLPISLKDCFDLEGFRTTAGTKFYSERNQVARADSAVAMRLRSQGAVIVGKTNLHSLAYGITGENPDFGDCLQPADRSLLTGGSTSGGAASVQEGSAMAAIGTDTGGSIRVPAALCGLAGYRASVELAWERGLWPGGIHLAQTFDTLGWIFRDLRDAPRLAEGLFGLKVPEVKAFEARVGVIAESFLHDCDAAVLSGFEKCKEMLTGAGAQVLSFAASGWDDAMSIYAPIQASEAAAIHVGPTGGDFSVFPKPIDERLAWGASLTKDEIDKQRKRHGEFRSGIHELFRSFDFLMMPCSPISKLEAGKDHTKTRAQILRYTVPFSLAGTPVVTLPLLGGVGMQLAAAREKDSQLLAFAAAI